jgi:hypothetical protein
MPQWNGELLESIWREKMSLSYKMPLIREMIDAADAGGCVALKEMAGRFQQFFVDRRAAGKMEDNPNRFREEPAISERTLSAWERTILGEPVAHMHEVPIIADGSNLRWRPEVWPMWSDGFKKAIRNTAEVRLIEYFDKSVPGGF